MPLPVSKLMNINLISKVYDVSISALAKWIFPVCLNIHTLTLDMNCDTSNGFHNEIGCLKKLKKLDVTADEANNLIEVTLIASNISRQRCSLLRRLSGTVARWKYSGCM